MTGGVRGRNQSVVPASACFWRTLRGALIEALPTPSNPLHYGDDSGGESIEGAAGRAVPILGPGVEAVFVRTK
ncbi:hypothetical protein [Glutamicibacter sp. TV12E]|uniref:hypothetical protein n=1 Tax=Glutamicibacter sp. TV12E TaxID=3446362 RepID=UPI0040344183